MFTPDLLAGKVALVTGASSGLGRHFAQVLARHGAAVVLAARRTDALASLAGELDGALLLLASDAGRYITGATLVVDGGLGLAWL